MSFLPWLLLDVVWALVRFWYVWAILIILVIVAAVFVRWLWWVPVVMLILGFASAMVWPLVRG